MKVVGKRCVGKDTLETLVCLKKLCIKYYGIGYIFATPKVRCVLLESMNDFIDELCNRFDGGFTDEDII